MRTWLCRILALVFLVQTLPTSAWAGRSRTSQRDRQLDRQVTKAVEQYPYDTWKQEIAELEKVLKEKDLSAEERKFAQLELKIAQTQVEQIDKLNELPTAQLAQINAVYAARLEALRAEEAQLEKNLQLRSFYQKAQSLRMIQASVYALHQLAQESKARRAQMNRQQTGAVTDIPQPDLASLSQPFVHQPVSTRVNTPSAALNAPVAVTARSRLLEAWAQNTITLEDVVEYMDPVTAENTSVEEISLASELLFNIFYSYNTQTDQIDAPTIANGVWLAKRLKFRAQHQLYVLEQQARATGDTSLNMLQARGNLMRVVIQVNKFLKLHPSGQEEESLAAYDQQLSEFAAVQRELAALRQNAWPISSVGNALVEAIIQNYQAHPAADSADFQFLSREIAYVADYLIETGNANRLTELVALVNQDKSTFHGKNELYVSAIFGSIFDVLIAYPVSDKTQRTLRQLLECAAAPVCHYQDTRLTNAVNVRTQALAVASMLRQVARTHHIPTEGVSIQPNETEITHLNEELFDDATWRATMASFAVDLYAPMQKWNVSEDKKVRYGLSLDEMQKYSTYLARIYESFLPVPEPKVTITKLTDGIYKGCWVREYDTRRLVNLTSLNKNGSFSVSTSDEGYPCKELTKSPYNKNRYGGFDTAIVHDSKGHLWGMRYFNPYDREQEMKDLGSKLVLEVATWYLWGVAFRGVGYLWRGARTLTAASKAAAKASDGMRLMRFNSKFTQMWKLSTNGWQTEMGLVNLQQQGDRIFIEMARPGYQGYITLLDKAVLQGHSLNSLKGRILLRRALQRDIYARMGHIPNDWAAGPSSRLIGVSRSRADEFTRPLTKEEQAAVRQEQPLVQAVTQELNEGISFDAVTAQGTPYTLYHPIKFPEPVIDLSTGLPEGIVIDRRTGNIISSLSRQYVGTVASSSIPNSLEYNIAAGITQAPSPLFTGRLVANHFPIIWQMNGLTKFVLTMTALDQPIYYWYVKPYMTDFSKRQDQEFTRTTGLDTKQTKAKAPALTVLNRVQSLKPSGDNPLGATLQGAFLGANQLLNYVLPSPIQTARQWMFKKTTEAVAAVDDPIREHLQMPNTNMMNILPLPGQVLSFPLVMASDPTPVYNEATRAQYQLKAQDQQFKQASMQHFLQDKLDNELKGLQFADQFMQDNRDILAALPQSQKELKRTYKVFEQELKKIKRTVAKNPEQAQQALEESRTKFINTHADIMTRASVAFADKLVTKLPDQVEKYKQNFKTFFTAADEEKVRKNYMDYCVKYKADLIELFTAAKRASETKQDAKALQKAAFQKLNEHAKTSATRWAAIDNELNARLDLAKQINDEWEADFNAICPAQLMLLPSEIQNEFKRIIGEFETNMNAALKHITDARTLETTYQQLKTKRDNEFDTFKQYWISQNPFYEYFFNRTRAVVEAERQARAAANAPFLPGQTRGSVIPWEQDMTTPQTEAGTWVTP